jgi:hypothetical protein
VDMKTKIELTSKEAALIEKIVHDGHTLMSITKSENHFDVGYHYHGGSATGGARDCLQSARDDD